jgi:hypothetical protein
MEATIETYIQANEGKSFGTAHCRYTPMGTKAARVRDRASTRIPALFIIESRMAQLLCSIVKANPPGTAGRIAESISPRVKAAP